ncbi:LpxL/LpxP family acyltransferase [Marmoricola sp. RAF53]|uniref:LpxL/LpxP family acyltransferase n=1 Tax=Marmoricola sp. RAF53 TaxID=3233059 RepID=UPI003F961DBA
MTDALQHVRALMPARFVPAVARRRVGKIYDRPWYREYNELAMTFLLGESSRADEIPALARAHAVAAIERRYMRYHPRKTMRQEVRGVEWLTTRRDTSRPVVLSFMHHHRFEGVFGSLKRHGVEVTVLTAPWVIDDERALARQHMKVVAKGATVRPASGGTAALVEEMKPGVIMAMAPDVAGQTPVEFLGRQVMGSFGSARVAMLANSPVVLVTAHRDGDGSYLQVHEPLEPSDFADPADLLAEILRIHGEAVLAWPEALDVPLERFGAIDFELPGVPASA